MLIITSYISSEKKKHTCEALDVCKKNGDLFVPMYIDLVELWRDEFPWKYMQGAKVIIHMIGTSGIFQKLSEKVPKALPILNQRLETVEIISTKQCI